MDIRRLQDIGSSVFRPILEDSRSTWPDDQLAQAEKLAGNLLGQRTQQSKTNRPMAKIL